MRRRLCRPLSRRLPARIVTTTTGRRETFPVVEPFTLRIVQDIAD